MNGSTPSRPLTDHERAIYRQLATDWVQLDAIAQATLYAAFLEGKLTTFLREVFADTVAKADHLLDEFTDPESRAAMQAFSETMQELDAKILLDLKMAAARRMDSLIPSRPLTDHERAIYRRLAADWARLDATAQSTLYTAFLEGVSPGDVIAAQEAETPGMETPGEQPVPVVDQVAELKRQVAALEAKLDRQRELTRARTRRWREQHPDEAREQNRRNAQAYRERRRRSEPG